MSVVSSHLIFDETFTATADTKSLPPSLLPPPPPLVFFWKKMVIKELRFSWICACHHQLIFPPFSTAMNSTRYPLPSPQPMCSVDSVCARFHRRFSSLPDPWTPGSRAVDPPPPPPLKDRYWRRPVPAILLMEWTCETGCNEGQYPLPPPPPPPSVAHNELMELKGNESAAASSIPQCVPSVSDRIFFVSSPPFRFSNQKRLSFPSSPPPNLSVVQKKPNLPRS